MSAVKIHIKDDIYTIVDADIAGKLKGRKLFLHSRINKYPSFRHKHKRFLLHRFVMNAGPGQLCDHINRNKLDNRRCNLRFVTSSQNGLNNRQKHISSSKYLRVYCCTDSRSCKIKMSVRGKIRYFASFKSRVVAALFADKARKKYSSVTPRLNFQSRIKRCHLPKVLGRTKGRIFSVVFVRRRDGLERNMCCRIDVKKNVKGTGLLFNPRQMNLFPVYDVKKKDYRFIPIENVLCLSFRKKKYKVVN